MSRRLNRLASFESLLERDLLLLLDFDPIVTSFEEQPVSVTWFDNTGRQKNYTPDLLVHFNGKPSLRRGGANKPWLIEVKLRNELWRKWSELKPRFRSAVKYAFGRGWVFRILTDKEIRTPYLVNVNFLRQFVGIDSSADACRSILTELQTTTRSSPEELAQRLARNANERAELLQSLWHLLATRKLRADLTARLTMATEITLELD